MQQAIPYSNGRTWMPLPSPTAAMGMTALLSSSASRRGGARDADGQRGMSEVVKGNAVVVVGKKGCCMCHVVRRLLLGQGVNPVVCEVDEDRDERSLAEELRIGARGDTAQLPAVFIGGRHVGGLDRLMAVHISGELVPLLKEAGALWL